MKKTNFLKSAFSLFLGLVCHVAWAQSTATIEVSASVDTPENMYEIKSSAGHWMTSFTSPSSTIRGCFAFFDDGDANTTDAYKIYSATHRQWVSYTKAASYSDGVNKIVLVDSQEEANAWNATTATVSDVVYYQFAPYTDGGTVAAKYWNWHGGTDSNPYDNVEKTVGFYSTGASGNGGSRWLLSKVTELATAEAVAEAQAVVAEKVGYPRADAGVSVLFNQMLQSGVASSTSLSNTVSAYKTCPDILLPEDGKAYTIANYSLYNSGTTRYLNYTAGSALTLSSSDPTAASVFVCRELSANAYAFVTEDGKILTWMGGADGYMENGTRYGYSTYYGTEYGNLSDWNKISIKKNGSSATDFGHLRLLGRRSSSNASASMVVNGDNGTWNHNSGDSYNLGNNNRYFSSAWIITEVAHTNTEAQTLAMARIDAKVAVAGNAARLGEGIGYACYIVDGEKVSDVAAINAGIDAATTVDAVNAIKDSYALTLPEAGKAYKMAFKTKAGALHHIVADDATLALSASTDEADASVFYSMQSTSADYPYIFVSAEGGFLTFKALSDAYMSRVTDFKVGGMAEMSSGNITSSVDDRVGTVYITTNKRPGSTEDTDGCFVFKNQNSTYDGADVPFHNDNFTSAIIMTEVEAESKTVYEVVVDGDANAIANAYVAYDNGTVVRKSFNGGFFVTSGATITEAQLSAGFVGNTVKSATISMVDNVITLSDVVTYPTPVKTDLYNTSNGSLGIPPHRIPGITVDPETGRIITTAARLVCGTDPGYGQVDVVCRISDDQGEHWTDTVTVARGTGITSPEENYFDTAFGDPAVVADRTSNEVLIVVVAGCTKYQTATRAIPNMIGTIHSTDNGDSWEEPVDVTEKIYTLFDSGSPMQSAFVGGGKIFQSRIVKVGDYYRLYAAMCARPGGNRVIYSDDFGRTWHALGGASALPAPGGDEPKCEELPDGRVILSSRATAGRIYNIYTYTNTATAEGSWGTDMMSTFEGSGKVHNGQSTNGEILIVPVVRNSDRKDMYLALQSLPAGAGRSHVGIFYKELTDVTDINTVANFAIDWNGYFEVTDKSSAYSSMDLQNDDRIGFIYEENYTHHGVWPNPHSIPFPDADNLGTHNYDGYDNIYVAYPLEIITNGAYSINREVDRRAFLQTYFTGLTADAVEEVKAAVDANLKDLSAEPTIGEVDNICFNIGKGTVITDLDANTGKIGGFTDAVIADYKAAVMAATTADELAAAKATALASAEWNMPVSGKAYTFKNVQKDGTTVRWYKYDATNNNIVLTANESEATPFVCNLLENGKYVFVCSAGKYMTWRANASGNTTTGVLDAYDMTANKYYTDITIAKMTTGGQIASGVDLSAACYVSISAMRPDRNEMGYVVVKKNGGDPTFDGASAAFWNDNFSSAFILEEAEAAFGNAPKVNDVEEGELLSEDLHNKHMSTFSATYATVVPEGVTAYYATREGEYVDLNAIAAGKAIPANTGVILVSEEGGNVVMLPAAGETAADVTGNLMGHSAGAAKDMTDVANAYLLTKGTQGVGFYRCSGGTLAANKAYLQLESAQASVRMRLKKTSTDIEGLESTDHRPQTAVIYDLSGRRVLNPTKGVYIMNGKKVIR